MSKGSTTSDEYDSSLLNQGPHKPLSRGRANNAILQTAALLTIWSLFVINEGAIRLVSSNPSQGLFNGSRPPPFIPFLGGLFEVIFGLLGLFIAGSAFMLRQYNIRLIKISMMIQTILGLYVFVVFVFVLPSFRSVDLTEPIMRGLSMRQSRFIIVMGIFTSFHFCLALQGGQFVFMARLIGETAGMDFLLQKSRHKMRAVFWNANLALAGVWTLVTGALINATVGTGRLSTPYISPPNIGVFPILTVVTGLAMICWGGYAVKLAMKERTPSPLFFVLWTVIYLLCFLNFTIVQLAYINAEATGFNEGDGATALHAGLIFVVTTLGPYFLYIAAKERNGHAV
ncbi:unnamed protein product [Agarophyton chilense]